MNNQELVKDLAEAIRKTLNEHNLISTDLHVESTRRFDRRAVNVVIVFNLEGV
jgi:hypothetical protein